MYVMYLLQSQTFTCNYIVNYDRDKNKTL